MGKPRFTQLSEALLALQHESSIQPSPIFTDVQEELAACDEAAAYLSSVRREIMSLEALRDRVLELQRRRAEEAKRKKSNTGSGLDASGTSSDFDCRTWGSADDRRVAEGLTMQNNCSRCVRCSLM